MDIKNPFLNEELEEKVFMIMSLGFNKGEKVVCKLKGEKVFITMSLKLGLTIFQR